MDELEYAPLTELLGLQRNAILYRPILAKITGRVTAAILLQQVIQYASGKGYRPFYKYRAPCPQADVYREGDSWLERLQFSPAEFDCARRTIGTKITKGMSKRKALMGTEIKNLVIYWTDSERVTWYLLNVHLLESLLRANLHNKS